MKLFTRNNLGYDPPEICKEMIVYQETYMVKSLFAHVAPSDLFRENVITAAQELPINPSDVLYACPVSPFDEDNLPRFLLDSKKNGRAYVTPPAANTLIVAREFDSHGSRVENTYFIATAIPKTADTPPAATDTVQELRLLSILQKMDKILPAEPLHLRGEIVHAAWPTAAGNACTTGTPAARTTAAGRILGWLCRQARGSAHTPGT